MKKYIGFFLSLIPLIGPAQLVMTNNFYVVLDGGTKSSPTSLVLTNSSSSAITNSASSWIISENEFNQVDWNIGTSTGSYAVPFGYGTTDYIPVTCNITSAGTGNGTIKFSTYHGSSWDNSTYEPSDVNNMTDFGLTNYSRDIADRFWILDAGSTYTTKPTSDITFTYMRTGTSSDIANPNYIVESSLIAQRYNSSLNEWYDWNGLTGTVNISANTATINSGNVTPANFYRSWCLSNDSTILTGISSPVNSPSIVLYPNPTSGSIIISGLAQGEVIELYDNIGQKISSETMRNTTSSLDLTSMANGIYLLRVKNNGNTISQKKLVKVQ